MKTVDFVWDTDDAKFPAGIHPTTLYSDSEDEKTSVTHTNVCSKLMRKKSNKRRKLSHEEKFEQEYREFQHEREGERLHEREESVEHYEMLVVREPNTSSNWIRYMAFLLQSAEIEMCRQVARRALRTIDARHETERLNVHCAWLSLETSHGDSVEQLREIIQQAEQTHGLAAIYTRFATILSSHSASSQLADQLYSRVLRKCPTRAQSWTDCARHLMRQARAQEARALMQRALRALPMREHVHVIGQFAQLEFRHGHVEAGRALFDELLAAHPRRLDQWLVYAAQLRRSLCDPSGCDSVTHDTVREVYERILRVPGFSARRVSSVFRHWLQFEERHGTARDQEAVRDRAAVYVGALTES